MEPARFRGPTIAQMMKIVAFSAVTILYLKFSLPLLVGSNLLHFLIFEFSVLSIIWAAMVFFLVARGPFRRRLFAGLLLGFYAPYCTVGLASFNWEFAIEPVLQGRTLSPGTVIRYTVTTLLLCSNGLALARMAFWPAPPTRGTPDERPLLIVVYAILATIVVGLGLEFVVEPICTGRPISFASAGGFFLFLFMLLSIAQATAKKALSTQTEPISEVLPPLGKWQG